MVKGSPFRRVLPKHAPSLTLGDYLTYVGAPLRRSKVTALHELWEPWLGSRWIEPTPTGRHALWQFLAQSPLQPGDEVLVAAYNFYVIIRLLLQRGVVPVFVDIDPDTLGMDPDDLVRKITPRSRLVLVTHLFGHPADMEQITRICQGHGLQLFEDCAHAVGTRCGSRHVGTFGDGALFSFGIYKLINTFGGGMLVRRQPPASPPEPSETPTLKGPAAWADHGVRFLVSICLHPLPYTVILHPVMRLAQRWWPRLYQLIEPSGDDPTYRFEPGSRASFRPFMTRMIQRQLMRLEAIIARRRAIVRAYQDGLGDLPAVRCLQEDRHGRSNAAYFGIYVPDPEALAAHLERRGIMSDPHEFYDCASLAQFAAHARPCPQAQYAQRHLLRLPNFSSLRDDDVRRIIAAIRAFFEARPRVSAAIQEPVAPAVAAV